MMAEQNGAPLENGAAHAAFEQPSEDDARLIELVGFLVQGIVAHPEEVEVEEFFDDIGSVYGVRVHADDVGRVIGREGRVASALRHLVKASAVKSGAHVTVEILTDDSPLALIDDAPDIADEVAPVAATNEVAEAQPVAISESAVPETQALAETPAKAKPKAARGKARSSASTRGAAPAARRGMMPRGGDKTGGAPSSEESSGD